MFDFILDFIAVMSSSATASTAKFIFLFFALLIGLVSFITGVNIWVLAVICGVIALVCWMIELAN